MKLLTHVRDGVERVAVVVEERAFDLPKAATIIDLIADPERLSQVVGVSVVGSGVAVDELFVTAPLWPVAIRCFDTFAVDEATEPSFTFGNPWAVCGPNDDVAIPPGCSMFDFGAQVGVVIGLPGRNIAEADALSHVAGYVLVNDWVARCSGRRDTATSIGPMLVTPDELPESFDLLGKVVVNGHTRAEASMADMAWSFASLISYASRGTTLGTGDLLMAGPFGDMSVRVGLEVGDFVKVTVDGLGEQSCYVLEGESAPPLSPRRERVGAS